MALACEISEIGRDGVLADHGGTTPMQTVFPRVRAGLTRTLDGLGAPDRLELMAAPKSGMTGASSTGLGTSFASSDPLVLRSDTH